MNRVINIENVYISNLTYSAILINSNEIYTDITYSLLTNCQSAKGAGIYSIGAELNIKKSCISSCYSTIWGSAFYSESNVYLNQSTICKCAPNFVGADDNIYIKYKSTKFFESNFSKNYDIGATCCQCQNSTKNAFHRIIHENCISESLTGKFFEIIDIHDQIDIKNAIFANSSSISVMEFESCTGTVCFEDCFFSRNNVTVFFKARVADIPQCTFLNVVITDAMELGTSSLAFSITGKKVDFAAGYGTGECYGFYSKILTNNSCARSVELKYKNVIVISLLLILSKFN